MSGGIGYMSDSSEVSGGLNYGKVVARGEELELGLDIGGALNPGFIVAASFSFQSLPNPNISTDTRPMGSPPRNPQLTMLALMAISIRIPRRAFTWAERLALLAFRSDRTRQREQQ